MLGSRGNTKLQQKILVPLCYLSGVRTQQPKRHNQRAIFNPQNQGSFMFKSLLQKLIKYSYYAKHVSAFIQILALSAIPEDTTKPIHEVTLNDLAFVAQTLYKEQSAIYKRLSAIRELYTEACAKGALGAENIVDVLSRQRRYPMSFPTTSVDECLKEIKRIKRCIFGKSGIGKTSLLWMLSDEKTLFFDLEAGDLAIEGWQGDTIRPRTWQDCRDISAFIDGPNPALRDEQPYSQTHYDAVTAKYGDAGVFDRYSTFFIDSITAAGRLYFNRCKSQPQTFSDQTGKPDTRGAYDLHDQEMIAWLTHLQHIRGKNIWFVGIFDEKIDDFNRRFFQPQIEGSKTASELPSIVDQVIAMTEMTSPEGKSFRVFICHIINDDGYLATDCSGRLDLMEEPHLGRLMNKDCWQSQACCQTLHVLN